MNQAGEPGSPPHMRGKENAKFLWRRYSGITPAHAGKSKSLAKLAEETPDHPRTCGEKEVALNVNTIRTGSPPHMRGKVFIVRLFAFRFGITPAHAGKSLFY